MPEQYMYTPEGRCAELQDQLDSALIIIRQIAAFADRDLRPTPEARIAKDFLAGEEVADGAANENAKMNLTDTTLALKHFQSSHEEANAAALKWCKLLGISPEDWSRWSDFTPLIAKLVSVSQSNADAAKMAEMERDELKAENAKLREALRWAMVRIESRCPHAASEGDSELYRFVEAKALTR